MCFLLPVRTNPCSLGLRFSVIHLLSSIMEWDSNSHVWLKVLKTPFYNCWLKSFIWLVSSHSIISTYHTYDINTTADAVLGGAPRWLLPTAVFLLASLLAWRATSSELLLQYKNHSSNKVNLLTLCSAEYSGGTGSWFLLRNNDDHARSF